MARLRGREVGGALSGLFKLDFVVITVLMCGFTHIELSERQ